MKLYTCLISGLLIQLGSVYSLPNFIIIFMDDMGYADMSIQGAKNFSTPSLDNMAAEGARFTDFYAAHNVCSASRSALMTGMYPKRVSVGGVIKEHNDGGLNPNTISIADVLKKRGYRTAAIGKWHLGSIPEVLPRAHGFDSYWGIPFSNSMQLTQNVPPADDIVLREGKTLDTLLAIQEYIRTSGLRAGEHPPIVRNEEIVEWPADQATLTRRYTDRAIEFIVQQSDSGNPFFVYLPHTMPHIPLYASGEFDGKNTCDGANPVVACGPYADVMEEADFHIGRIIDTLKALGIDSNTLVVFSSDNGGNSDLGRGRGGSNVPLRGKKGQTYEGGQRVPTIMWWPGTIPAGTTPSVVASTIDLLPTFAAIIDVPLPIGETVGGMIYQPDGINIYDWMTGKTEEERGKPFFYETEGVRMGDWKLLNGELYNLKDDIGESVIVDNPSVQNDLAILLSDFSAEVNSNKFASGNKDTPEPVEGCTNLDADNYDENAMRDDGSCVLTVGVLQTGSTKDQIQIYTSGRELTVYYPLDVEVAVWNTDGKKVIGRGAAQRHKVNTSELPTGVYLLSVMNKDMSMFRKFLIP